MATSNTDICNLALKALGLDPISSLATDTSQAGIILRNTWEATRDAILRAANWRCLLSRSGSLAREAAAPSFGYSYAYALPTDCIRVMEMSVDAAWEVEGRLLLTDEEEAYIRYVAYNKTADQVALFDGHLTKAIVAQLAVDIAPGLKSKSLVPQLEVIARDRLADAKVFSAIEARPKQATCTALLDVR
ncbi:MAG: hypothetical protein M0T69_01965 [Deltaproteobacteria bacterium]|nr:hypothetical protein [Deltaproteobacteria bacterium]